MRIAVMEIAVFLGTNAWNFIIASIFISLAPFSQSIRKNIGRAIAGELLIPGILTAFSSFGRISDDIAEGVLNIRSFYAIIGFIISVIGLYTVISMRNKVLANRSTEGTTKSGYVYCMSCGNHNSDELSFCTACGKSLRS